MIQPVGTSIHANSARTGAWAAFVLACAATSSLYASVSYRGMYADGAHYLVTIASRETFYFANPSRRAVDWLRQTPTILLRKYSDLGLPELAQVFSASMLLTPILLIGLCWPILPAHRKAWIAFPIVGLFAGISASAFNAIGEGAIGASYCWLLLFLLLFRSDRLAGRLAFLALSVPAFYLHEATLVSMLPILAACFVQPAGARGAAHWAFLVAAFAMSAGNAALNIYRTIDPFYPGDRNSYLSGLLELQFLTADHRVNLALVIGALGLAALLLIAGNELRRKPARRNTSGLIALIFAACALLAAIGAWSLDITFIPFAQTQARNHGVFVSAVLGLLAVAAARNPVSERAWMQRPSIAVVTALCLAQCACDAAATWRWRSYVADFDRRLAAADGLVSWETVMASMDADGRRDWRLMSWTWSTPSMSIALSRNHHVSSIILNPADPRKWHDPDPNDPGVPLLQGGIGWQPFDPLAQNLPYIRGVTYSRALLTRTFDPAGR